ncbi:MAG: response regulator [Chitinivibrionales bacterium]|nr:response regulator [Chitinivibrionales bacterium]
MGESTTRTAAIINDDITQLTTMAGLLEKHGYTTIPCTSAEYALETLSKKLPPSVIITDIQMPGVDGWRFCQIVRSKEYKKLNQVPIIMISAVFKDDDVSRVSREIGADAFLTVPVNPQALLSTIDRLLGSETHAKKTTVLVGGAVTDTRRKMIDAFASQGYQVITAADTGHCLQQLRSASPTIAVLFDDLDQSGLQECIRDMRRTEFSVTLVCCVPESRKEFYAHYVQAGADACLRPTFVDNYPVVLCEKIMRERAFVKVEELLRKRTWELEESREKYRTMMDSMVDPIYICAGDYGVEYVNKAMIRLIGDNPVGKECYRAIFGNSSPCPWCNMNEVQAERNVEYSIECTSLHRFFTINAAPLYHPNGGISQMSILHDTTRQKELETRLRHAQKMEALGHLAGGVAHDFNNMLGAILGFADMVKESNINENSGTPVDDVLDGRMETIIRATNRAGTLVKQLLAFSRQGKYLNEPVDMHRLIDETVALLERTIDKRIVVEKDLRAQGTGIVGDPQQLLNALINLGVNARDAMPNGGTLKYQTACETVTIESKLCRAGELTPGNYLRIDVTDTGGGIPPELQPKIFDPFFTTKEQGKGTGLGLASVYGTMKNHAGHIYVRSGVKRGTTFTIYLPLSAVSAPDNEENRQGMPDPANGSETILIVDDEDAVREIAQEILKKNGYTTVTCTNGKEAVEYYEKHYDEIDMAIIDMIMPEKSGDQCFEEMKKINHDIKALLFTGYSAGERTVHMLKNGMVKIVRKPFTSKQLLDAVATALKADGCAMRNDQMV